MPIKWNCLEPLTAIGIGIGACALAPIDMGLAAAGVIGGSGLLARIKENSRKAGLEDDKLIARMQKQLLGKLDHWDSQAEREAALRADEAMKRLLPQVMLTREQLAATATKSGESAERYPVLAARLVVAELARHDAMFAEPAAGAPAPTERLFALDAVEAALRAAKDDPAYATLLTLDIAIELGRAQAETLASIREVAGGVDVANAKLDGLDALVRQLVERQQADAASRDVNAETLITLASRIVEQVSDPAEAEQALHRAIDELLKLREEARRGTNFGDEVDEAIRRIFAKVEADDLDGAARTQEAEFERLAELVEEARAAQLKMADTGLSVARLRYDADAMAHWAVEKRRLAEGVDRLDIAALRAEQYEWYERALNQGSRLEMDVAIALALRSVEEAGDPQERAMCQNNLGAALQVQGERSGGDTGVVLLAEAVEAYSAALTVRTREAQPADWAMTQNNLGTALQVQGERSGGEAGVALLAESVAAYRAALTVLTREALPAQWAMTHENLAEAELAIGDASDGEERMAHWRLAEEAVLLALEVYDPVNMPYDHGTATELLARIRAKLAGEQ